MGVLQISSRRFECKMDQGAGSGLRMNAAGLLGSGVATRRKKPARTVLCYVRRSFLPNFNHEPRPPLHLVIVYGFRV